MPTDKPLDPPRDPSWRVQRLIAELGRVKRAFQEKRSKVSLRQISEKAGYSTSVASQVLTGTIKNPSSDMVDALAAALADLTGVRIDSPALVVVPDDPIEETIALLSQRYEGDPDAARALDLLRTRYRSGVKAYTSPEQVAEEFSRLVKLGRKIGAMVSNKDADEFGENLERTTSPKKK